MKVKGKNLLLFCCFGLLFNVSLDIQLRFTNRILVKLEDNDFIDVKTLLKQLNFSELDQIIPGLYSFKFNGEDIREVDLQNIKTSSQGKIIYIEHVTIEELKHDMQPAVTEKPFIPDVLTTTPKPHPFHLTPRHGMGVEKAWNAGYNGQGVTVAVNDVGVDYDIPELSSNINLSLSWNFIKGTNDVRPEIFYNYPASLALTDHGNRCSGLIASRRENTTCGVGIAYKATLAVLKPFRAVLNMVIKEKAKIVFSEDDIISSLVFRSEEIDIYSNSWSGNHHWLSLPVQSALLRGIKHGRNGKGSIFVFPSGKMAEGYSNSMYTICVNSFDPYGGKPENFSEVSACTLTSTFGEGSQRNLNYMVTSSHGNEYTNCTLEFKGTSASCPMVAAIIALALQANPNMTWRDVQHVLVRASNHTGLNETMNFKKNGAGFYYHKIFGFGLLDAFELVTIAETWENVGPQQLQTEHSTDKRRHPVRSKQRSLVSKMEIEMRCKRNEHGCCVERLEHVKAKISYKSPNENNLHIYLLSPAKSESILLDRGQSDSENKENRQHIEFLSVNFWGEDAVGTWTIVAEQFYEENSIIIDEEFGITSFILTVTGTKLISSQLVEVPAPIKGVNELSCLNDLDTFKSKSNVLEDQSFNIASSFRTYLLKWYFDYICLLYCCYYIYTIA